MQIKCYYIVLTTNFSLFFFYLFSIFSLFCNCTHIKNNQKKQTILQIHKKPLLANDNDLQIIRDLGFMIPDIFHFIIPIWLLRKTRRENYSTKPFYRDHKLRRDTIATFFIVAILLLVCAFL